MFNSGEEFRIKISDDRRAMTKYEIAALERIMSQIELGYTDINGDDDTDEIRLIENALYEYEENHKGDSNET